MFNLTGFIEVLEEFINISVIGAVFLSVITADVKRDLGDLNILKIASI